MGSNSSDIHVVMFIYIILNLIVNYAFPAGSVYGFGPAPAISESTRNSAYSQQSGPIELNGRNLVITFIVDVHSKTFFNIFENVKNLNLF